MGACRECGGPLRGRADRRFCSDACRNEHNNRRYRKQEHEFRPYHRSLRQNHRILDRLLGQAVSVQVPRERLVIAGFAFNRLTGIEMPFSNGTCPFAFRVYGFRWTWVDEGTVQVERAPSEGAISSFYSGSG